MFRPALFPLGECERTMLYRAIFRLSVAVAACAAALPVYASGHAEGGKSSGGVNPLSLEAISKDLSFWTTVVFLCLLAVLWKFAWKPIAAALDKRETGIADKIAQAEAANTEAKRLLAEHERRLADAKTEVHGILDQGRRDAEKLGQELLEKARAEVAAEQVRGKQEIEAAADAAVKGLADKSAQLAVELAGKIVGTKLNPKDHARLIEQAVGGFEVSRN
jgi:F-type H+-transporting ATPase subunit b